MPDIDNIKFFSLITELLSLGKVIKIPVRGMSMFPFLLTGDVVMVKRAELSDLKFGRVIVIRNGENWVAHRLVGQNRQKGLVYTRGDGLAVNDKPVKYQDVAGVVIGVEQSRWMLARVAVGSWSPVWAFISPVTGPLFRATVKVIGYLAR